MGKFPGIYTQGYADDVALFSSGFDLSIVRDLAQQALSFAGRWSRGVGLSLNDKSSVVLFTNKRKFRLKPLTLEGKKLEYSGSCTYLGTGGCSTPTWGLGPKGSLWIYKAVVRPAMEYAAMVWLPATNKKFCGRLRRVQGLALRMVTGALPTTPTAALETLLGVLPIQLRLQEVALQSYLRLRVRGQWLNWVGYGRGLKKITHIEMCSSLAQNIPELGFPYDYKSVKPPEARNFKIRVATREEWLDMYDNYLDLPGLLCFTDGSRGKGGSGAAFIIGEGGNFMDGASGVTPLGNYATVFQAELIGVLSACNYMSENPSLHKEVNIFVDNRSVLDSLLSERLVSSLTVELHRALQQLSIHKDITLHWIPSHWGLWGNEDVDKLAKEAASITTCGPEPVIPVNSAIGKFAIKQWAQNDHRVYWSNLLNCKFSKLALPIPYEGLSGKSLGPTRDGMRLTTFAITGHCNLNGHLYKMGLVESPICEECGEGDETMAHILTDCPAYSALRFRTFLRSTLRVEEVWEYPLKDVLAFLRSGRFASFVAGESREAPTQ
ncbi:uncharacterized protein LOC110843674 [Folsomia candida]|uniref:uncharacterized protein LOC110843674 n=1 Tax=Folsomia candida TaxID=158441 RepID=UPI001604D0B5|nr:uncharacterized protein LOC110843674 [Folsomia candida]